MGPFRTDACAKWQEIWHRIAANPDSNLTDARIQRALRAQRVADASSPPAGPGITATATAQPGPAAMPEPTLPKPPRPESTWLRRRPNYGMMVEDTVEWGKDHPLTSLVVILMVGLVIVAQLPEEQGNEIGLPLIFMVSGLFWVITTMRRARYRRDTHLR